MAEVKITDLVELVTIETGDVFAIVDIDDDTQANSGSTKKITIDTLEAYLQANLSIAETDPVFTASPAANVVDNLSNTVFLSGDGTYQSAGADGNGIYDGSGTIPTSTISTITDLLTFDSGDIRLNGKLSTNTAISASYTNYLKGDGATNFALIESNSGTHFMQMSEAGNLNLRMGGTSEFHIGRAANTGYAFMLKNSINRANVLLIENNNGSEFLNYTNAGNFGIGITPSAKLHVGGDTQIDGDLTVNVGNTILGGLNNIVAIGTNDEVQDGSIAFRVKTNRGTLFSFEDRISGTSSTVRLSLSGAGILAGTNLAHQSRVYLGTPTLLGASSSQMAMKTSSGGYSLFTEGSTASIGIAVKASSNVGIGNLATGPYKFFVSNDTAQGVVARFDGSTQVKQLEIVNNGGIGINGTPVAETALDIQSTTATLRLPRLSTTTRDALTSPVSGMFIYNSTLNGLDYYNGTAWTSVGTGGADGNGIYDGSGSLSGATTVTQASNDLTFSTTGNANTLFIDGDLGRIGFGTNTPLSFAHFSGDVRIEAGNELIANSFLPVSGNYIDLTKNAAADVGYKIVNTNASGMMRLQLEGDASSLLSLRNYNASGGGSVNALYKGSGVLASTNKDLITSINGTGLSYKLVTDNSAFNSPTVRMEMNQSGEFGFGTAPTTGNKLTVGGDTQIDGFHYVNAGLASKAFQVSTSLKTNALEVYNSGLVGIEQSSPSAKLDIKGNSVDLFKAHTTAQATPEVLISSSGDLTRESTTATDQPYIRTVNDSGYSTYLITNGSAHSGTYIQDKSILWGQGESTIIANRFATNSNIEFITHNSTGLAPTALQVRAKFTTSTLDFLNSTKINIPSTLSTTSATAGTNGDVPAQVDGYITIQVNGVDKKVPYYAV